MDNKSYSKAKDYLEKIKEIDTKIDNMIEECQRLDSRAKSCTSVISERVQTSKGSGSMENSMIKILDLEKDIDKEIDKFIDIKRFIIRIINEMDNDLYVDILYRKYFKYESLYEIANAKNYAYRHLKRLHKDALKSFSEKVEHVPLMSPKSNL